MNYDITFCRKRDCKNLKCGRNQKNIPKMDKARDIWVCNFKECKYWEDKQ